VFGFFTSLEKKMRANAENWLELADKAWHYRRDQLTDSERKELVARTEELRQSYKQRAEAARLKLLIERLEPVLRRVGGKIYPKTTLIENVEFFLVAAIVILGIRTYFVQPFKIPTNSMWPSYYGMTPEVYRKPEDAPGPLKRVMRFALLGARHKELIAPESGTVMVPVYVRATGAGGRLYFEKKPGRSWLIFPATNREYVFYINDTPVRIQVPEDFDFDWAFQEATGMSAEQLTAAAEQSRRGSDGYRWVALEQPAQKGKPVVSFDILTGDQLFVDRFSNHFMRPQVGQGFVFRTGNIPDIAQSDGDQYYIKRLVGLPGDTLEIKGFTLYRNGQPIAGARAFERNARREDHYTGYRNLGLLAEGQTVTVPRDAFFALGDNSANSRDGRFWGFVPAKDVIGRPLFIYYPFTKRWGPVR